MKILLSVLLVTGLLSGVSAGGADTAPPSPASPKIQTAVLGGGCFWCMQALYELVPGVVKVTAGYAGGTTPNPTYEEVCTDTTGHAEVVKIEFNSAKVSYSDLLKTFWEVHNPTTLNRQGPDHGTQYRSIILYENQKQKEEAEHSRAEAQKHFRDKIVTQIVPLRHFYRAEEYHQDYFAKHPNSGYCVFEIAPKVRKLEERLKAEK